MVSQYLFSKIRSNILLISVCVCAIYIHITPLQIKDHGSMSYITFQPALTSLTALTSTYTHTDTVHNAPTDPIILHTTVVSKPCIGNGFPYNLLLSYGMAATPHCLEASLRYVVCIQVPDTGGICVTISPVSAPHKASLVCLLCQAVTGMRKDVLLGPQPKDHRHPSIVYNSL